LAASAEPAANAPVIFVQRWGLDTAAGSFDYHPRRSYSHWGFRSLPFDYHAGTHRLLTVHGATAVLWDAANGLALDAMDIVGGGPLAVAFSGDGRRVLTASGSSLLRVWDVQTGEKIAEFVPPSEGMMAAAFSPDGRRVAAGCDDHTVWIGEVDMGGVLRELPAGHRHTVISLRFSPDSRRLLSGSYDRQAILWDVQAGRLERVYPVPVTTGWTAFRADGRRLLTLGRGHVIEWDTATRQPVRIIWEDVPWAWFVGDDVVVPVDGELRLYRETEQGSGKATDPTVLAPPLAAGSWRVAPGGWQMWFPRFDAKPAADDALADRPESPVLRSPAGETVPLPLPLRSADRMEFIDISPDGTRLLTVYEPLPPPHRDPARLILWDLTVPEPVHSFTGNRMGRFHPDGRRVLVSSGRSLQLCRADDGRPLQTYEIDYGDTSARFVAGGRQLLTASGDWYEYFDGQVLLWDVESGEVLRRFYPGYGAAYHAVMDRDEKRVLAKFVDQSRSQRLHIYDAASAELLHVISSDDYPLGQLHAHPPSNRVATGNEHDTYLWNLTDLRLIHQFPGAPGPLSADGRFLATFLRRPRTRPWEPRMTLLWNAQDGRYLGRFDTEILEAHPGGALAFTQDHRTALGVLDLQTGRPVAELFTFNGDQWLAVTGEGHVAGSEEALQRVTWRTRHADDGLQVEVDAKRTARQHRPHQVAEALTRSLPDGRSPADALPAAAPELPEGVERRPGTPDRPRLVVRSAESPACSWLAADAEGNRLLASYEDGSAALWQLRPVQLVHRFPPISRSPRIALTPDGMLAIVEGPEPTELTLWDTATGRRQGLLPAPDQQREEWIVTMAMHPGGRFLAVLTRGRDDESPGRTLIWDLPARRVVHRLVDRSPRRMADLAFTPDGSRLALGYRAAPKGQEEPWDRIDVWDWQAETRERSIRGEGFGATSLAFSDDGRRLLAKEGSELVLRDFDTGEPIARWSFQHGIPTGALTGDGARLVGSTLGDGRLFRSTVAEPDQWTWTPPAEGRSHTSRYYAHKLVVMGDRNLVFSPGNDGRIHVWNLDTLAPAADLFTRNEHRDWIVRTSAGAFAATEGARPQLAWEHGGRHWALERFERWLHRPETVAAILSGEPAEPPAIPPKVLEQAEAFHDAHRETRSPDAPSRSHPEDYYAMRDRAVAMLNEAGAELRINRHDHITFVHLERRPVGDALLRMLPWLQSIDRLYLAATGITDEQLCPVGLMGGVKRLSLWSNPITDAGLAELNAMWSLEVLDIHDTQVTAAGLRKLCLLPELRTLIVPEGIDAEALAAEFGRPGLQVVPRAGDP
jgi:WD40 repeat protein